MRWSEIILTETNLDQLMDNATNNYNLMNEASTLVCIRENEIDKLRQQIAELEKDKARLDWLERIDRQKYMFNNWIGGGGTLRTAIDLARSAT